VKSIFKKVVAYSLVGVLQCGIATASVEAARNNNQQGHKPKVTQHVQKNQWQNNERDRRKHEEMLRHEREMQRRPHESEWAWRERQRHENDRHDEIMRDILGMAILIAILNNND